MVQLIHEKVIRFNGSILGFENYDEFLVTLVEDDSPYAYLQSLQDENIGFLVVTPFVFHPEYTFEIDDKHKTILGLKTLEEVAVFTTVTIREPYTQSTVNLLAPLVINITNGQGRQIVLPPKSNYGTNEPLFRKVFEESGE
ncbi:flagellar assembly protein FliW [Paenibacillus filicis]|uniref:Flagellar assembly factor FliW n=1 Tax=Paenibacillus gyeongsangnamensis TaxID=3388067 RepID=A0ABT4QDD8_9BACL|nr:flagellar assembly protein FliW [Paenibacillus filicis]MCZ8514875.1 flagellar assembly protein FliW [Paenibacillus filicis]